MSETHQIQISLLLAWCHLENRLRFSLTNLKFGEDHPKNSLANIIPELMVNRDAQLSSITELKYTFLLRFATYLSTTGSLNRKFCEKCSQVKNWRKKWKQIYLIIFEWDLILKFLLRLKISKKKCFSWKLKWEISNSCKIVVIRADIQ